MFTGIITDIGEVRRVDTAGERRFEIATAYDLSTVDMGASICCSGCCLTVVEKGAGWFAVEVSAETISKTTLGAWRAGTRINLERALRLGDELGGHLVSGHVDGVGRVLSVVPIGESVTVVIEAPTALARFIATKGSVTVEGVSLTVNGVDGARFDLNIIPHTRAVTTLGRLSAGDAVNLEIDLLARYVSRLRETES
ncbi:MAG: riboflavin synthase [Rhodospirillaceae bacterium]